MDTILKNESDFTKRISEFNLYTFYIQSLKGQMLMGLTNSMLAGSIGVVLSDKTLFVFAGLTLIPLILYCLTHLRINSILFGILIHNLGAAVYAHYTMKTLSAEQQLATVLFNLCTMAVLMGIHALLVQYLQNSTQLSKKEGT